MASAGGEGVHTVGRWGLWEHVLFSLAPHNESLVFIQDAKDGGLI